MVSGFDNAIVHRTQKITILGNTGGRCVPLKAIRHPRTSRYHHVKPNTLQQC